MELHTAFFKDRIMRGILKGKLFIRLGIRILDRDAFSVAKTQQPTVTVKKERQKFVF